MGFSVRIKTGCTNEYDIKGWTLRVEGKRFRTDDPVMEVLREVLKRKGEEVRGGTGGVGKESCRETNWCINVSQTIRMD